MLVKLIVFLSFLFLTLQNCPLNQGLPRITTRITYLNKDLIQLQKSLENQTQLMYPIPFTSTKTQKAISN